MSFPFLTLKQSYLVADFIFLSAGERQQFKEESPTLYLTLCLAMC